MKMKKIISVFIAAVMVFGLLPQIAMPVQAAGEVYGVWKTDNIVYQTDLGNKNPTTTTIANSMVTHLYVENGVTEILGFAGSTALTTVEVQGNTTIGINAFQSCTSLTTVKMPNVTKIGNQAFYACNALATIQMPEVTSVGDLAFYLCSKLTSVQMPKVNSIGIASFESSAALISVQMPMVTLILDNAFSGCTKLTNLTVGATPPTVGANAFLDCPANRNLTIDGGNTAKAVAAYKAVTDGDTTDNLWHGWTLPAPPVYGVLTGGGLYEATSSAPTIAIITKPIADKKTVNHLYVASDVTIIDNGEFADCTALTTVTMPAVTEIGSTAFPRCTSLTIVTMPAVTEIGGMAFENCAALETITIPKATTVWKSAFENCISLSTIAMPEVTTIGSNAFLNCTKLTTVTMPNVTEIVFSAFQGCTALATVTMPEVTSIGFNAFNGCTALTTVTVPEVTEIGSSAFVGCTALTNITVGATPPTVNSTNAFYNCPSSRNLTIDGGTAEAVADYKAANDGNTTDNLWYGWALPAPVVEEVYAVLTKDGLFRAEAGTPTVPTTTVITDKKTIDHLYVRDDVTSIGISAFYNSTALTTLKIQGKTSIGENAFYDCKSLTTVTMPEVTAIGGYAFQGCTVLSTVEMPLVTIIDAWAFRDCINLATVAIPEVTSIGFSPFANCTALTTVAMPKVETIGNYAFNGCTALANLTVGAKPPKVGTNAFFGCPSNRTLIIADSTADAINAYKTVSDGNINDNLWYGWTLPAPPPTQTNPVKVNNGTGSGDYTTGSTVTINANIPPTGKQFKVWTIQSEDFTLPNATSANTTFVMPACRVEVTATYEDIPTTPSYNVSGTVEDDSNNKVSSATVKLMKGNNKIGETTTTTDGTFTIINVPNGTYNLVVSKDGIIVTTIIVISGNDYATGTITLPSGKTNSVVEVKPNTPQIVVGNLDNQFIQADKDVVTGGGSVEIKLVAEAKNNTAPNAGNITATASSNGKTVGQFIDLSVFKTTTPFGRSPSTTTLGELPTLVVVYIPLDTALRGKTDYVIYRYHGSAVNSITTVANADGEKIELVDGGATIKLTTKKFSTYAVAYKNTTTGGGSTGGGSTTDYSEIEKLIIELPTVDEFKKTDISAFEKVEIEYSKLTNNEKSAIDETLHNKYKAIAKLVEALRKNAETPSVVKPLPPKKPTLNPQTGDSNPFALPIIVMVGFGMLSIWSYGNGKAKNKR